LRPSPISVPIKCSAKKVKSMANLSEFQDQRWLDKREELLRRANYICEYCGEYDVDAQVHICYYPRGKRLWEFPEDAYKCYCPQHRTERQNAEDALRVVLAKFVTDDLDRIHLAIKELSDFPENKRSQFAEQLRNDIKKQRLKLEEFEFYEDEEDGE